VALLIQNPPNAGTLLTVGPLGVDTNFLTGFDISGLTGIAYASLTTEELSSALYLINLGTGAATLVGLIGPGTLTIVDIAAPVGTPAGTVLEPATLMLLTAGAGALLAMGRRRR
jgi:uncharacterized protein DUF4394